MQLCIFLQFILSQKRQYFNDKKLLCYKNNLKYNTYSVLTFQSRLVQQLICKRPKLSTACHFFNEANIRQYKN